METDVKKAEDAIMQEFKYQQQVEKSDPWVQFAGMFKDDPLFDEFVEDMDAYRRELDTEIADEATSQENQSAYISNKFFNHSTNV